MIRAADTDGSGVVEFNEFLEMMAENMEVSCNIKKQRGKFSIISRVFLLYGSNINVSKINLFGKVLKA